jgi:hypothetical protein
VGVAQARAAEGNPAAHADAAGSAAENRVIGSERQDVPAEFRPHPGQQLLQQARRSRMP